MSLRRTTKAWLRPIYRRFVKPIYSSLRRRFGNGDTGDLPAPAANAVVVEELLKASARQEATLQQVLAALGRLPRLDQIPQPPRRLTLSPRPCTSARSACSARTPPSRSCTWTPRTRS
jgi:hypothetical protein